MHSPGRLPDLSLAVAEASPLDSLEALLRRLPPFTARVVEQMVRRGRVEEALKLVQHSLTVAEASPLAQGPEEVRPAPPADTACAPEAGHPSGPAEPGQQEEQPPRSAGLLIAQALRHSPGDDHPLPCPSDDDPRWLACKARAVQRIKLKSGAALPFKIPNNRHGERPGPGAFVALLLALMLYFRDSEAISRFSTCVPQWALAGVLGVSTDTLQDWQRLPEVARWVQSWRYLDPGAEYKRAGMLYTVLWNPDHRHKKTHLADLLRLPLRSLAEAISRGHTRRQFESERLHISGSLKAGWAVILPLNKISLSRFGALKGLVDYVAAQTATPSRTQRMAWAEALASALERHLGLGEDAGIRRKLYWKIALTCLRGLVYGGEEDRYTPLLQLRRALGLSMAAQREGRLYNVGAFFSKRLREAGFFDLAGFYAERKVA
jgi:hypothetical protein